MSDQFGMPEVDTRPPHEVITELRQQLSSRDADVAKLNSQLAKWITANCPDGWIGELRQQLAEANRKIEHWKQQRESSAAYERELRDKLTEQVTLLRDGMDSINTTGVERAHKWAGMSARDIARITLAATEPKPCSVK